MPHDVTTAEDRRLAEDATREKNWKRWGPYLAERQWGTVREDYSAGGNCWDYFPHDHARSRVYRWGEDGLLGLCDREQRLCFALALWNGRDPILKERLFGLTGPEGNHGEDVKELYFYQDATPTHSYAKAMYRYPHAAYPYARLVDENRRRGRHERELELVDTGALDDGRFCDVVAEYAKAAPDDVLIRVTVTNHGSEPTRLDLLPTLWFRNTWSWGRTGEGYWPEPRITANGDGGFTLEHASLGTFVCAIDPVEGQPSPERLFTNNETNATRLYGSPNPTPFVKDAFHRYVVDGDRSAVNPAATGTKAAALYQLTIPAGERVTVRLRLTAATEATRTPFGRGFEKTFATRMAEADAFYATRLPATLTPDERHVAREAYASLFWSKQFFYYDVRAWLEGDPSQPAPPPGRDRGRNHEWRHLYNRDVVSMPDKWEYPWYAAWDLAFHMLPFARVDAAFAKEQLLLFLREWYMHPNGQLPAYEFAFGDVNPPVHAWAVWRVYKASGPPGARDRAFLSRAFQKLLLNFTWWVNRKDAEGKNIFGGGFLGMDNIGVFDRSQPLPTGGHLEQADGTAWMAFYCLTLMAMALELAKENPACEDIASKMFEHFVTIADAINEIGTTGLWDERDGFYYDELHLRDDTVPLRVRSLVGLVPLLACEVLEQSTIDRLPGFAKRMDWFLRNRPDLTDQITWMVSPDTHHAHRLLALPSRARLERILRYMLDEQEFLAPNGIRSLSKVHQHAPYTFTVNGHEHRVDYTPGESTTGLFGGNSNWRGPIWFPLNFLLVEALERYHHFYGDGFQVECPTGSGVMMNLGQVAQVLSARLASLFVPDASGHRPCHGTDRRWADDPRWRDLVLFHEYFDGDTGRGLGASHQTGWTALVTECLADMAKEREA